MNPGSQSQLGSHTIMQRTAAVVFLGSADILSAPVGILPVGSLHRCRRVPSIFPSNHPVIPSNI